MIGFMTIDGSINFTTHRARGGKLPRNVGTARLLVGENDHIGDNYHYQGYQIMST